MGRVWSEGRGPLGEMIFYCNPVIRIVQAYDKLQDFKHYILLSFITIKFAALPGSFIWRPQTRDYEVQLVNIILSL